LLISLSELKPSPWNPKKPFTKKQLAAIKKGIAKFGWKRSLCVCRDFQAGEGYLVLDGNDAIKILSELKYKEVDCHVVENVTDEQTLQQFMGVYSINKQPLYSEFASALGEVDFAEFTGLDYSKFSFDVKIDDLGLGSIGNITETEEEEKKEAWGGKEAESGTVGQTQYFLTLPPDCVEKLKGFVKTKAYKAGKTEAIAKKIDAMNDNQFLENVLQIIL